MGVSQNSSGSTNPDSRNVPHDSSTLKRGARFAIQTILKI